MVSGYALRIAASGTPLWRASAAMRSCNVAALRWVRTTNVPRGYLTPSARSGCVAIATLNPSASRPNASRAPVSLALLKRYAEPACGGVAGGVGGRGGTVSVTTSPASGGTASGPEASRVDVEGGDPAGVSEELEASRAALP